MTRRAALALLAGSLVAGPRGVGAQPRPRVWRIGYLGDGSAAGRGSINLDPFREGLRELGYVEGQNLAMEVRWSEGRNERLGELAAELVRLKVDVLVTHGLPASRAAKAATTTIPIVIANIADILGTGMVSSLARPGGNITGLTDQALDLSTKEVGLLKQMMPSLDRVGIVWNRTSPTASRIAELSRAAARAAGLQVTPFEMQGVDDLDTVLDAAVRARPGALIIVHDPITVEYRARIAQALLRRRLPGICASPWMADAGLLMAYGPDQTRLFKRAAVFVDKILKGARPGDLPVEQPTQFDLIINLKTARALGITVPPSVLLQAARVIE
ncbi:MAG: ABC transporter substrate-binding protein [Candidatus Rokubacteria bacterium]|nr:ABC transporter substrate-binding protein [Candidatus Rokubacteria bacterium]